MRTPIDYKKHIENNEITEKMISDCAYSMNKRGENMLHNEEKYHYQAKYDHGFYRYSFRNEVDCREKKEHYFYLKRILLSPFKPTCIYKNVWETLYGFIEDLYLVTEVGDRIFYQELNDGEEEQYKDLEIISIDRLRSNKDDTNDLISVQFATKVVELIKSGQYTIVEDD